MSCKVQLRALRLIPLSDSCRVNKGLPMRREFVGGSVEVPIRPSSQPKNIMKSAGRILLAAVQFRCRSYTMVFADDRAERDRIEVQ